MNCAGMRATSLCPDGAGPDVMWSFQAGLGTYNLSDPNGDAADQCIREVAF
jgi:hypothetical protein